MGSVPTIRTPYLASLLCPLSGSGLLHLVGLTGTLALLRAVLWFLVSWAPGVSTAAVMLFGVLGFTFVCRAMVLVVESSAEGFDLLPALPDPREVEELFGAFLKVLGVLFFTALPVLLAGIANLHLPWLVPALVLLGALYFPAGMLGVAVRGDVADCFPGTAGAAIRAAPLRYATAAVLSAGAAAVVLFGHLGAGAAWPLGARLGLDAATAWILLAALHRVGAVHRDTPAVRAAVPFPAPDRPPPLHALRSAPPTEIEKILAQRLRREPDPDEPAGE